MTDLYLSQNKAYEIFRVFFGCMYIVDSICSFYLVSFHLKKLKNLSLFVIKDTDGKFKVFCYATFSSVRWILVNRLVLFPFMCSFH